LKGKGHGAHRSGRKGREGKVDLSAGRGGKKKEEGKETGLERGVEPPGRDGFQQEGEGKQKANSIQ